jgi:cytochrome c oxidase cbb3-type subunit III
MSARTSRPASLRRCAPLLALPLAALTLSACQPRATTAAANAAPQLPAVAYDTHVAAGGRVPPGGTLHNPHAGDKAVASSGALLFTTMNCDGCHGAAAAGSVGPNLGDGRWRYGGADAAVFMSIYYGRPKGMPAFGGVLGEEGVWTLVTYLRSLPPPENLPTQSWEKP